MSRQRTSLLRSFIRILFFSLMVSETMRINLPSNLGLKRFLRHPRSASILSSHRERARQVDNDQLLPVNETKCVVNTVSLTVWQAVNCEFKINWRLANSAVSYESIFHHSINYRVRLRHRQSFSSTKYDTDYSMIGQILIRNSLCPRVEKYRCFVIAAGGTFPIIHYP